MAVQLCLGVVGLQRGCLAICDVTWVLSDLRSTCHVGQSAVRHWRLGGTEALFPLQRAGTD